MNELPVTAQSAKGLPRPLAERSAIDPFIVMDVMGEANARELSGDDIIHMEVGQPASPAPKAARERARQALENQRLGYTEALGLPKLRERIARHMSERYGVGVRPERVVVTAGSSAGFVLAFLALLDQGYSLGLPSPGYPCYRQILKALNVRPTLIETSGQGRWMPTVADVERLAGEGAAGLLLASPNNPTSTMALSPRLAEIAETCRRHGLWLISDEIYHGLEYEAPAETALAHSDEAAGLSSILPADGAFYLYADISRFTGDSEAFAKTMLKDIGVAVTPGIDFDPDRGRNYIRFCYAGAEAQMREAARRITGWLKGK